MRVASAPSNQIAVKAPTNTTVKPASEKAYEVFGDTVRLGAATSAGTGIGLVIGVIVGEFAKNAGGNAIYGYAAPVLASAIGTTTGFAAQQGSNQAGYAALTAGTTGIGTIAGDVLGHALTAFSNQAIYQAVGAGAGALIGASAGLNMVGMNGKEWTRSTDIAKYTSPALGGAVAGMSLGVLTGHLVTYMTGNSIYSVLAPVLGGIAGGLSGLAAIVNYKPEPAKPERGSYSGGGD